MKKTILLFATQFFFTTNIFAQLNSHFNVSGGWPGTKAKDLGAAVGDLDRGYFVWRGIQQFPFSNYQWQLTDSVVQGVQANGIELRVHIKCTNPYSANDTIPGTCAYNYDNNSVSVDNESSWFPEDTLLWKKFIDSLIERYDDDGINDMPGLIDTVKYWHIGQEWARIWCSQFPDTSLEFVKEYVQYANITYNEIKKQLPQAVVSVAGIDGRIQKQIFYDGYTNEATYCQRNDSACMTDFLWTKGKLDSFDFITNGQFSKQNRNTLYLLRNAQCDEVDIHQYGRWQFIPDVVRWLKDSTNLGSRQIVFLEGGGPFCKLCDETYHNAGDSIGQMSLELVRDNSSYVVYYYIVGIASGVKLLNWSSITEYANWGATWGDLDLVDINQNKKPSYYTYRFLAKNLLADANADTIYRIPTPTDSTIYYYRIAPMKTFVLWSTNPSNSFTLYGNGTVYLTHIPTVMGDSIATADTMNVIDSVQISLSNGVPVFIDENNFSGIERDLSPSAHGDVVIYPNPFSASATLVIRLGRSHPITFVIYDLLGREMKRFTIQDSRCTIKRNGLPNGMYLYKLTDGTTTLAHGKMVIQ